MKIFLSKEGDVQGDRMCTFNDTLHDVYPIVVWNQMFYEVCCLSNNKDYVSQLIHFTGLHFSFVSLVSSSFNYKKENTSHFTSPHFTSLHSSSLRICQLLAWNNKHTHTHTHTLLTSSLAITNSTNTAFAPTHSPLEAVYFLLHNIYKFSSYLTGNTKHLRCVARNSDH
jgi:hypothetical protein